MRSPYTLATIDCLNHTNHIFHSYICVQDHIKEPTKNSTYYSIQRWHEESQTAPSFAPSTHCRARRDNHFAPYAHYFAVLSSDFMEVFCMLFFIFPFTFGLDLTFGFGLVGLDACPAGILHFAF